MTDVEAVKASVEKWVAGTHDPCMEEEEWVQVCSTLLKEIRTLEGEVHFWRNHAEYWERQSDAY